MILIIQLARQFTVPHLHTIPAFCFRCLHYNCQHYPPPFGMSINIAFLATIKFQDSSVALNVPIQIITIHLYELERPFVDYRIEPCGLWSGHGKWRANDSLKYSMLKVSWWWCYFIFPHFVFFVPFFPILEGFARTREMCQYMRHRVTLWIVSCIRPFFPISLPSLPLPATFPCMLFPVFRCCFLF